MIRRTKAILNLPSRDDKIMRLSFNESEKDYYQRIEQPVVDMLDQTTEGNNASVPWMTAIQQINKLRLVCNMGTFVPSSQPWPNPTLGNDDKSSILTARLSLEGEICMHCLQLIEPLPLGKELEGFVRPKIYYSACNRFYCADCSDLLRHQAPQPCECIHQPRSCPLRPLQSALPTPRLTPTASSSPSPMDIDDNSSVSSKVWALISQIRSHPDEKQ